MQDSNNKQQKQSSGYIYVVTISKKRPVLTFTKQTQKDSALEQKREIKRRVRINWTAWLFGGITLFLMSIILEKLDFNASENGVYVIHLAAIICRDISIALISAALIAKIIELPNVINFVNDRTIEALSNNNFLKSLDIPQLNAMKLSCTKLIFEKNGKRNADQFLNDSLADYELQISDLLLKPYHEYYKLNIHCENIELPNSNGVNQKFMKKTYKRNFKIINPLAGSKSTTIFSPFNIYTPENFECLNLVSLSRFTIIRDNLIKEDLTDNYKKPSVVTVNANHPNYNSRIHYVDVNSTDITFESEIIVEIEEVRFITHNDPIFVHRVSRPTKNFSIVYSNDNPEIKLKIDGFGADANLTEGDFIKVENGNYVAFDVLKWLLPGNGIMIASVPKEDNNVAHPE
jgi:hypothetical protein